MIRQYSTGTTTNTLYEIDGEEVWHCKFESENHPVNIKWKMSGQPPKEQKGPSYAI